MISTINRYVVNMHPKCERYRALRIVELERQDVKATLESSGRIVTKIKDRRPVYVQKYFSDKNQQKYVKMDKQNDKAD